MKTIEEIKEYLEGINENELLAIWNCYCDNNNYDDHIYYMYELDEILNGETSSDIINKVVYGSFNSHHDYFKFNGYGNLQSEYYLENLMYINDLAQYIYDNDEDFDNDDLRDFLDEDENNEEDY